MKLFNNQLKAKIIYKKRIKIIAGLHNFNINNIMKIVRSVQISGTYGIYIDIAANPRIVSIVRSVINLPICVSSINALDLYKCKITRTDFVEIGIFDIFYNKKISFSKLDILGLVKSAANLVSVSNICITIPHKLCLHEQIELVTSLYKLGVCIIQTEGETTKSSINITHQSILNSASNAAALSSTYTVTKYTKMTVIASSGINALSAPVAISYGASCVGIGSSLHRYGKSIYDIVKYIREIRYSVVITNKMLFKPRTWQISFVSLSQTRV